MAASRKGADLPSIDDSIAARDLSVILAEWRDAERRLQLAAPDSAEHSIASGDSRRLREEYQRAYTASQRDRKAD